MKRIRFFLVCLLIGCTASKHEHTVRIALDWSVNTGYIGMAVAQEKGFYRQAGISVDFVPYGKTSPFTLLNYKKADVALTSEGELIFAHDQGMHLKTIATLMQHNPSGFYSLKKRNILIPKDLQGKTYGGWGSDMEDIIIKALIQTEYKGTPSFENHFIGDMNIDLALKKLDFVWGFEFWQGQQLKLHHIDCDFMPIAKYLPQLDTYAPVLVINGNDTKHHNTTYPIWNGFLKATQQGYQWATQHPEESIQILLKMDPTLSKDLVTASFEFLKPYFLDSKGLWGRQNLQRYQEYIDFVLQHKLIRHSLQAQDIVTNEYFGS